MLASLTSVAEQLVQQAGYLGLVLIMAVEHIFPPIPSELVLPLTGFEVARGGMTFGGALAASTIGSLLGASALYAIARRGGRPLVLRMRRVLGVDEAVLKRAEQRFSRHSGKVVFFGRMVPGVRSVVSIPPGLLRMPFGRYLALTAIGSLAWNAWLILAGQQLGARWSDVAGVVAPAGQILLAASTALVGGWWLVRTRRRRAQT